MKLLATILFSLSLSSCVSFDLTDDVDYEPNNYAEQEPEPVIPALNRAPDSSCYLYQGELCVAPVIETTSIAIPDETPQDGTIVTGDSTQVSPEAQTQQ